MQAIVTSDVLRMFNPLRWTGPVFDKELRVASRRRRTYLLRFVYVGALTLFVLQSFSVAMHAPGGSSAVVRMSQMGLVASGVVSGLVWFQFILAQLLAIVLLSGAIGSEVRQGSLTVLLATPVSSLQIVLGKLLSGLLQLILLLAVSLPLLAVVRVLGGVPWGYVVRSLCTTLAAAVFAGSLSLFLSVANRHAHRVVSNAVGWCLVLWAGGAALLALLRWAGYISHSVAGWALYLTNPFAVMGTQTASMLAATPGPLTGRLWGVHCLVLAAGTTLVLLWAVRRLRRVTLAVVPGEGQAAKPAAAQAGTGPLSGWRSRRRGIRRVTGSPLVWREVHQPLFPRGRRGIFNVLGVIVAAGAIVAVFVFLMLRDKSTIGPLCYVTAGLLQLLFIVNLASSAASTFTREKEARTLPILLTVPLDNAAIVIGKAVGLLRRNLPLLIPVPLLGLLAYWLTPPDHISFQAVLAIAMLEVSALGDVVLLLGLGLCLSAYLKATTPAVVATFVVYIAFRILVGSVMGIVFLAGVRYGLFRPENEIIRYVTTFLQVVGFGGLGVLLAYVASTGLRRHST